MYITQAEEEFEGPPLTIEYLPLSLLLAISLKQETIVGGEVGNAPTVFSHYMDIKTHYKYSQRKLYPLVGGGESPKIKILTTLDHQEIDFNLDLLE
jgi:hypothetical protein